VVALESLARLAAIFTTLANSLIETYHVKCLEELLDLSSPHHLVRLEPNREKHIPDRGAQDILVEYISIWRRRTKQAPKDEPNATKHAGEGSGTETLLPQTDPAALVIETPTVDAIEQQASASKALAEPATIKHVVSAAYLHVTPQPGNYGPETELSSASQQTVKPRVWEIADEI
jgi:hypothetical protein